MKNLELKNVLCPYIGLLSFLSLNHSSLMIQLSLLGAGLAFVTFTIKGIGTQLPKIKASPCIACFILVM